MGQDFLDLKVAGLYFIITLVKINIARFFLKMVLNLDPQPWAIPTTVLVLDDNSEHDALDEGKLRRYDFLWMTLLYV